MKTRNLMGLAILILCLLGGFWITRVQAQGGVTVYLPVLMKPSYAPEKGLLLPGDYAAYCEHDMSVLGTGWYYNHKIEPEPNCGSADRRFVPRIYKGADATDARIATAINNARYSGWLMGFGEPNLPWQGYTSPQEGAIAWRKIEQAAIPAGIKLIAPGPSQHSPGYFDSLGYTWVWQMVAEYEKLYNERPHFDAMAWHYYGSEAYIIRNFLTDRRTEALAWGYDVPFWILEYAGECWNTNRYPTGNYEIMTQITPWFKSTPWITRYAWFTNRITGNEPWGQNHQSCSLLNPYTGELNTLGALYATY